MRTIRPLTAATTVLAASTASFVLAVPTAWSAVPDTCDGKPVTIKGTDGDDIGYPLDHPVIVGTPGDDVVHLGAGDDYYFSNGGKDTVCGGDGADVIRLEADGAVDGSRVFGEDGRDTLYGTGFSELLSGGRHGDRIVPNGGSDTLAGGAGVEDQVDFAGSDSGGVGVTIEVDKGTYSVPTGSGTVSNVERFTGTNSNDVFRGTEQGDDFKGLLGDDNIRTFRGPDYVQAAGDSVVRTGLGRDYTNLSGNATAYLGKDRDTAVITGNGDVHAYGERGPDIFSIVEAGYVNGGRGNDAVTLQAQQSDSGVRLDLATGKGVWIDDADKKPFFVFRVERVTGTKHRDVLKGRDHHIDVFYGGNGNDTFWGRGGADRFYGEKGKKDRAFGGPGDDLCVSVEIKRSCREIDLNNA